MKGMSEDLWPELHRVVTESFRDHYDSHPLPFDLFRRDMINETTDLDRWRLAFDGPTCVGVSIGSGAEPEGLGYGGRSVSFGSTAGVASPDTCCWTPWPETLRRASRESLHCDATNPTGATALYESVGMRRDHEYVAWRTPCGAIACCISRSCGRSANTDRVLARRCHRGRWDPAGGCSRRSVCHLRELLITMQRVTQIREPQVDMQLRSVVDGLVNHTGRAFSRNGSRPWSTTCTSRCPPGKGPNVRSGSRGSRRTPRSAPSRSRPVRS